MQIIKKYELDVCHIMNVRYIGFFTLKMVSISSFERRLCMKIKNPKI